MVFLLDLFGSAYQIMQISDIEVTCCNLQKRTRTLHIINVKYELRNLSRHNFKPLNLCRNLSCHNFKLLNLCPHFYKLEFERLLLISNLKNVSKLKSNLCSESKKRSSTQI